jgi:hypothetical protein
MVRRGVLLAGVQWFGYILSFIDLNDSSCVAGLHDEVIDLLGK